MQLRIMTIETTDEPAYRLVLATDDRAPADAARLVVHDMGDGAYEVEGCPHSHATADEAASCPEARITLGDIVSPLPDLQG